MSVHVLIFLLNRKVALILCVYSLLCGSTVDDWMSTRNLATSPWQVCLIHDTLHDTILATALMKLHQTFTCAADIHFTLFTMKNFSWKQQYIQTDVVGCYFQVMKLELESTNLSKMAYFFLWWYFPNNPTFVVSLCLHYNLDRCDIHKNSVLIKQQQHLLWNKWMPLNIYFLPRRLLCFL